KERRTEKKPAARKSRAPDTRAKTVIKAYYKTTLYKNHTRRSFWFDLCLSSRRSSAIYQVSGFYAAAPQLDLNFVLQSCKAFDSEGNSRGEAGSQGGGDSGGGGGGDGGGGGSVPRSLMNYYAQARVRNAYAKGGSFADQKPFGCPKCGRCFTVKGNMTRHLKYECGQAPRFQCPYCEFRSKQTSNVMSHIRTRHTGQRVYVVHLKYEN
ncbi:uncharacterized protein LOC117224489, partial [Megalopta genalis]|uniref:uncharacterized protein LOC117224489 n=1 Tax=Megalopta genalis TaxID=115081 RepID=UPI003FD1DE94